MSTKKASKVSSLKDKAKKASKPSASKGKMVNGQFDLNDVINYARGNTKDARMKESLQTGDSLPPVSIDPKDYVVMPRWFKKNYGILGLLWNKMTCVAGPSDTGKTTFCIEAMKNAQAQGAMVIYVETEGKTSTDDLEDAGINTSQLLYVNSGIIERAWQGLFQVWDAFYAKYPDSPVLVVFDSLGSTVSRYDADLDIAEGSQKPGGSAKTNKMGINKMVALMDQGRKAHALMVSTVYANIGSVGNTITGGNALYLQSMLVIETKRVKDLEKTVQGVKVKVGIKAKWKNRKNHFMKALFDENGERILLPLWGEYTISADGIVPEGEKPEDQSVPKVFDLSGVTEDAYGDGVDKATAEDPVSE